MNKKKHTQIQRILRLENIVTQLYIKVDALKTIIDKQQRDEEKAKFYEDQEQKELEHQEKVRGVQN